MEKEENKKDDSLSEKDECCKDKGEDCCKDTGEECDCSHDHDHDHGPAPAPVDPQNPFANLDEETQGKIQQLQMMEQQFQQLLMQKNAFSMEGNETDLILKELEKTNDEVFRIIGNQVVIKSSKEDLIKEMKDKKELVDKRMKVIDEQEAELTKTVEELREDVLKKIQG